MTPPKKKNTTTLTRTCPVCGDARSDPYLQPPRSPGPVVKCRTCGFVYVNPVQTTPALIDSGPVLGKNSPRLLESSDLDDIKGSWEAPMLEHYQTEFPAKRLNARDALRRINALTAPGTLLDVGCGAGLFLSVAAQEGWDCYGLEPLVMHAIFARGYFGLRVLTNTLADDAYAADFFDVVTSFQVFEHLIYPDRELEKIRRILKPGGLVLIEVPNIDTLGVRVLGAKHRHFVQDHVSFFSARTLTRFVERFGFRVRETYHPTRVMSVRHLNSWLKRSGLGTPLRNNLVPASVNEKFIRLNLRDIVAIIAQKD